MSNPASTNRPPSPRRSRRPLLVAATATFTLTALSVLPAFGGTHPTAQTATPQPAAHALARHAATRDAATQHATAHVRHACDVSTRPGMLHCFALARTDVVHRMGVRANQTPSGYGPSDLQSAYALASASSANGGGATVGIIDAYDDPNAESDLGTYRSQYGLPACTTANGCFRKVDENGGTSYPSPPPSSDDWTGEISLDLDMVSAICPNCHILLVEASQPATADLGTSVNTAVRLGAKYVSNSYGGSEDSSETSSDTQYYDHPGVAVVASAGDSGYGVSYPAASPDVVSVGGTSLSRDSSARGWSETVWGSSSGGQGTGSGCSQYEPKPSWQTDSGCSNRTVADVSAVADPATGVAVYDSYGSNGGWNVYGGTSASSPIIASVYALAGTPGANDNPASYPYGHTADLNDVTSGANGSCSPAYLCTAGTGYDGPTGLGTPNGTAAFTAGNTPPGNTVTLKNPGSQSWQSGHAVSLPMSATDSASGQTLTWSASGLPAGVTINASSGLISGTPSATGSGTAKVTATDTTKAAGSTSFDWTVNGSGSGGIVNGGFESGNLNGWTATGTTSVVNSGAHSGIHAAQLGGTSPTNGDSSISQTFTVPSGSTQLSFWYNVFCPDTVQYDWATATLKDNTSGTTTTPLAQTCANGSGWTQVTAPVTAGHNDAITLTSHDDNYPGDPTYTLYDDVTLNGNQPPPSNDFSPSASPSSVSTQPGTSVTTTISTAVTSGSAQSVSLSASGLPSGATATFNPTSVTAGNSSTLTIATASSTPAGTSTVTVTGTGAPVTHTTTMTLTVGAHSSGLTEVSTDPFTDTDAQHATEVEPDTYAYGNTIVSAFQVGRVYGGGASDLGWATSTDGGQTWQQGDLPGITVNSGGGSYAQVSDASVAYDPKHGVWLIAGLPIDSSGGADGVLVSSSTDGLTWRNPVNAVGFDGQSYDKNWIVCDDHSASPYYGNCYIEADITSSGNAEIMATSTDGGQTWGAATQPAGSPTGLGGQPVVQPNGTVIVPFSTNGSSIESFSSSDGGQSWSAPVTVSDVQTHPVAGGLRDGSGLPSAEIDGAGTVYVAWQDCRFETNCSANDIVYSTSSDGQNWSTVTRVPIDAVGSGVDHFIPGIGVDHATSGATAKIGLYYYFYPNANCSTSTCQMEVGYISSANGGQTWSTAHTVAGPFSLSQIASTSQGSMVGDYISCSVVNGNGIALFAVGKAPSNGQAFDEGMYTVAGGIPVTGGATRASTTGAHHNPPHTVTVPPVTRR